MVLIKKATAELQDKDEKYRALTEICDDPLAAVNNDGVITGMNNALVNITGLNRRELKGSDLFELFIEEKRAKEKFYEAFNNEGFVNLALTLRHKTGKLTDVLVNCRLQKNDHGEITGAAFLLKDITAQKKFENELIEAKKIADKEKELAQEAMAAKQQFLSNMSHEMRTPLNAIIGFTKVLQKTNLNEKQKEYLGAIKISGDALIVLINDILDLAKVDAGKMTFEQIPFSLYDSIFSMLQLFSAKLFKKKLELVTHYDENIPKVLMGDPVRLHQIILNLVSNAIKFTKQGSVTVSVKMIEEDEKKVTIRFSIADTGIGIPEEKLAGIFENFQQASTETSRIYGGTGLGLAIVKHLVELQGGEVSVKSKQGQGSEFSFTLSLKKTREKVKKEINSDMPFEEATDNIRILIVEDVALNQLLMKTLIEDFGFEQDIASNGKIAIEKLQQKKYDLVLMDIQMPEMNGFEATDYIRNNLELNIPVIALTADVTTSDVEKCRAVGMNDYIAKPVDEKLLYNKIIKYAGKPNVPEALKKESGAGSSSPEIINLDYLKQRAQGNNELMKQLIKSYIEETPELINKMKRSIDNMDWEALGEAAHSIIPSFAAIGINQEFEDMAKKIKEYAIKKEGSGTIGTLVQKIEAICQRAMAELKDELRKL